MAPNTATVVYEAHHHGFRLTVTGGGEHKYQIAHKDSLSDTEVATILRAQNVAPTDVTILPAQA